jgi:hypothetical protein
MFSFFNAREAKSFGTVLANFFIAQMPVKQALDEKKFAAKTQSTLRSIDEKIGAFKAAHPLNGYKKAQLGNTFKWALKDAGYDADYVDKLTDWLITRL